MLLRLVSRRRGFRGGADRPLVWLFALQLAAAMFAVQLGSRFFLHYYLLLLPALSALVGFAAHIAASPNGRSVAARLVCGSCLLLWLADRSAFLAGGLLARMVENWSASALLLVYWAAVVVLLGIWAIRPWHRLGRLLTALVVLEAALLVLQVQSRPAPPSLPHHQPDRFSRLEHQIRIRQAPGDRLFVWGWAPEIYTLTRLEASSHLVISQYIVNDVQAVVGKPELNRELAAELMTDLEQRRPRFIVDATSRSATLQTPDEPWLYDLELYPDFALRSFLRDHYRRAGRFDGCDLYVVRRGVSLG